MIWSQYDRLHMDCACGKGAKLRQSSSKFVEHWSRKFSLRSAISVIYLIYQFMYLCINLHIYLNVRNRRSKVLEFVAKLGKNSLLKSGSFCLELSYVKLAAWVMDTCTRNMSEREKISEVNHLFGGHELFHILRIPATRRFYLQIFFKLNISLLFNLQAIL